ncbi:MAG: RNB domain-containing ribonuclease [Burkholderiaceae bacterium]
MSHVLFEEDGGFKAASILSDAGASLQIEYGSGRRAKIKSGHVVLRFDSPDPATMMADAAAVAADIELDFLWECAPQQEFGFLELADEYFGHKPAAAEAAGLLLRLHGAPVYFHRKGRGRFRPAPPEVLKAALAAVERKRQLELRIESDAQALLEHRLPEAIGRQAAFLLVKPDKQSAEYRALERACQLAHRAPERVLLDAGAFASPRALHLARFAAEYFPHGLGFPDAAAAWVGALPDPSSLPLAAVEAFSVDDSTTTEIDDCLSVTRLPQGAVRVGVHIAAPGFALAPGGELDELARERMSTVYMPGDKITMLPDELVAGFSLDEGRDVPVLSLYADLDDEGTRIVSTFSQLERIRVAANLRHDLLDGTITEQALDDPSAPMPFGDALRVLWTLTQALCAERERVRGKPEPRFRTDFSFYVDGEQVRIVQRRRDAPLDRIVAEMMIFANSTWGQLLAEHRTSGIYRSQQAGRVRTSTHPLPHQGLGVSQYMWSTSPLRRYVDLVNQRQLLAVLAGSPPPFGAQDADLFAVMTAFDARYAGYADFQTRMERYWCLRWLEQRGLGRLDAVVVRDDLVRLTQAPLYFRMADLPMLSAGRPIVVDVLSTDVIDLSLEARYVGEGEGGGLDTDADDDVESLVDDADGPLDTVEAVDAAEDAAEEAAEEAAGIEAMDSEAMDSEATDTEAADTEAEALARGAAAGDSSDGER